MDPEEAKETAKAIRAGLREQRFYNALNSISSIESDARDTAACAQTLVEALDDADRALKRFRKGIDRGIQLASLGLLLRVTYKVFRRP